MARGQVVILAADFLLQIANFLREKFHRASALGTDHVVMAATVVLVLVASDTVVKGDFAGKAAFSQKLERAIYRGVSDMRIFLLHEAVKFVSGQVISSLEKGAEDGIALGGLLQADALEVTVEYLLGFAHHLARERGLVVDALLEHEGLVASQDIIGRYRT